MAADEYFDAIGSVLSYVLSAEDFIYGQMRHQGGIRFEIERDANRLTLLAFPDKRYFTLINRFSLSQRLVAAYESDNQLLRSHIEEYDIDDSAIGDEHLNDFVARYRISQVGGDQAQRVRTDISSYIVHSNCRIQNKIVESPIEEAEELWDGVRIIGLLYPYEDEFSPSDYESVAQEAISVGNQIDEEMGKLDVIQEIKSQR